jgi:hypothetical protein
MDLVKCNHCRKETKNDTGKCRWCNKELERNLDTIHNKLIGIKNSEIQDRKREIVELKKQKYIEDNFWICGQCQEENELNIEVCWKCQNVDKQNNTQKIKKSHSNQLKDEEIKMLSIKIIDELRSSTKVNRRIHIIVTTIFMAICWAGLSKFLREEYNWEFGGFGAFLTCLIIYYPYHLLYKRFINKSTKKIMVNIIKKLGLENHKYLNEVNDVVKYNSDGMDH